MNISQSIQYINPALVFGEDYLVQDNGNGPELIWKTLSVPRPTEEELQTAWLEVEKQLQEAEIKKQKSAEINKIATLSDQLNLIASVLDTITSENPDQTIIANAKAKFNEIKTILNK